MLRISEQDPLPTPALPIEILHTTFARPPLYCFFHLWGICTLHFIFISSIT